MTRRIIRKFTIEDVYPADPKLPGHALVPEAFGRRVQALAAKNRPMTFLEAQDAFALAACEYDARATAQRGSRLRGAGGRRRWRADKVVHTLLSYVMRNVPARHRLRTTGDLSLAEAMCHAFGCGQREIELAWSKRDLGKNRRERVKR